MIEQHIRDAVDWAQPFPAEEYAARRAKLRHALAAASIDAIFVTSPADVCWLTGYDHCWNSKSNIIGSFHCAADDSQRLFIDNRMHVALASAAPETGEVMFTGHGTPREHVAVIADVIKGRGWATGRVAIQPWAYGPHPDLLRALGDRLDGAEIVDASDLVEDCRLIKSPREVAVMREAAVLCDRVFSVARDAMGPGTRETDVEAIIIGELMREGCGYPGIRTMIGSGPRSGAHHGLPNHRRMKAGDIFHIDFCASLHRYHANLSRSLAIGEVDARWHDVADKSAGCIDAMLAAAKLGEPLSSLQEVADAYIDDAGLRQWVWFVGGYTLGIAMPPDWVGRHRLSPSDAYPMATLEPGLVFNFENQFDIFEGWPGGTGLGYIETFLVTDDGLEVLSKLPRDLVVAG